MEERVSELRHEIVRSIKDPLVLQYLTPSVISQDDGCALKRQYRMYTQRANHRLLDLLYRSQEPGKWTAFIQALQKAEYPYLARLLQTEDRAEFNTCSKLMELFGPELEQRINPAELMAALRAKDVISAHDQEVILAKQTNEGAISAAMMLLERIQTRLEPSEWYTRFLQVLHENNQSDIATMIDPDFDIDAGSTQEWVNKEAKLTCLQKMETGTPSLEATDAVDDSPGSVSEAIREFRDEIGALIKVPDLISHLTPSAIDQDTASRLIELSHADPVSSANELLEYVIEAPPSVHNEFLQCLRTAGYLYLFKLLSSPHYQGNGRYLRKVMAIFEPTIQNLIDPVDTMSLLVSEGVIDRGDKETILTTRDQHGRTAAAVVMLERVQCRLEPRQWYIKLLQTLVRTDNLHVVRILEPDFLDDPDNFTRKLLGEAPLSEVQRAESITTPPTSKMDIDKAIKFLQDQEQSFLQSADVVRKRLEAEKRKHEELYDKLHAQLEGMITDEQQRLKENVSSLNQRKEWMSEQSSRGLTIRSDEYDLSIETDKEYIVVFTVYEHLKSLGEVKVIHVKKHSATSLVSSQRRPRRKSMLEDNSSSSSYLEVTDQKHKSSDRSSSTGYQDELEEEMKLLMMRDFDDDDDDFVGRHYQSVNLETVHYSISFDIEPIDCCDIAVHKTDSYVQLLGLSLAKQSICIFDADANPIDDIPCNEQYSRIACLTNNEYALIRSSASYVHVMNLSHRKFEEITCNCIYAKKVLCTGHGEVYILCSGKHLHILSQHGNLVDIKLRGIATQHWKPTFASVNNEKSKIFITDAENNIYCFSLVPENMKIENQAGDVTQTYTRTSGKLLFCNTCESVIVSGIFCLDDFVLIADKYNDCIHMYTAESWLFKDTIAHEALSDCKIMTRGVSEDDLVVVCEKKAVKPEHPSFSISTLPSVSILKSKTEMKSMIHGSMGVSYVTDKHKCFPDNPIDVSALFPEISTRNINAAENQIDDGYPLEFREDGQTLNSSSEIQPPQKPSDQDVVPRHDVSVCTNAKGLPPKTDVVYFIQLSLVK